MKKFITFCFVVLLCVTGTDLLNAQTTSFCNQVGGIRYCRVTASGSSISPVAANNCWYSTPGTKNWFCQFNASSGSYGGIYTTCESFMMPDVYVNYHNPPLGYAGGSFYTASGVVAVEAYIPAYGWGSIQMEASW